MNLHISFALFCMKHNNNPNIQITQTFVKIVNLCQHFKCKKNCTLFRVEENN